MSFGSLSVLVLNTVACNSKTEGGRANLIDSWEPEVLLEHVCGTFDLVARKVISGHSVHLPRDDGNSKRAGHIVKRIAIWDVPLS